MEQVVVGVDGSDESRQALRWALDLAARAGSTVCAARCFDPPQAELPPGEDEFLHQRQRTELGEWVAEAGGTAAEVVELDGDPASALIAAARDRHAELLVVGGRGSGGFTGLHLGSVAHHLTHHTTVPLAVVPSSGAQPVARLVLGVDGSKGSQEAVRWCAPIAAALGVGVTVIHTFEPLLQWSAAGHRERWEELAEQEVGGWIEPLRSAGVDVEVRVEYDSHPVAAIDQALGEKPGSVAVVGVRGLGGFSGLRLGRVPLQVLHRTGDAVVVVPVPPS